MVEVADNAPVTVPVPKFNAPPEITVKAPVDKLPSVRLSVSLIWDTPPVRVTEPVKLLLAPFKVMALAPALMVVVPETSIRPAVCLTIPSETILKFADPPTT